MARYKRITYNNKNLEIVKTSGDLRENVVNTALVALRRRYLYETKDDRELENRIRRFNNTIKKKEINDVIKIIKFFMRSED